jgi:hypothetical protein
MHEQYSFVKEYLRQPFHLAKQALPVSMALSDRMFCGEESFPQAVRTGKYPVFSLELGTPPYGLSTLTVRTFFQSPQYRCQAKTSFPI